MLSFNCSIAKLLFCYCVQEVIHTCIIYCTLVQRSICQRAEGLRVISFQNFQFWQIYITHIRRSMNHNIYDITNNGDSYLLDFSSPFIKPHLLSMCNGSWNINLIRGVYTEYKPTCSIENVYAMNLIIKYTCI